MTHGFPCRAFAAVSAAFTHKKAAALTLYVQYSSLFFQSVFIFTNLYLNMYLFGTLGTVRVRHRGLKREPSLPVSQGGSAEWSG